MCRWSSLAVQWLGLHTFTADSVGLIPGQGTKILHFTAESVGLIPGQGTEILQAIRHGQNSKKKKKKLLLVVFFKISTPCLLVFC